jgi:hypothetical protein
MKHLRFVEAGCSFRLHPNQMPDVETNANLKLFTISLETKTNSAAAFMNESCFLARNVAIFTSVFGLLMGRS